jgi:hypothetical protein
LGLAALVSGDVDAGITRLEQAIADDERLGNRPLAALTAADLARAHLDRGQPNDREVAIELLDRAIREADAMDLTRRAADWRKLRTGIDEHDEPAAEASAADNGTIERRGSLWVLNASGREIVVPDLLGMNYLVQLLTNPDIDIPAAVLAGEGDEMSTAFVTRPEQPVLDDAALASYRTRVAELEDDIAEAEQFADLERAARARAELDAVIDELTRTTNRFGKTRPFASSNERARTAVQKAVRRALDHIERVDPVLGAALRASVQTGRSCSYRPEPGAPARWENAPASSAP